MTARRANRNADAARLSEQERELEQLRAEVTAWRAKAAALPIREDLGTTSVRTGLYPARSLARRGQRDRAARTVSLYPRHPPHDVPGPALDHAAVRRLRHRRRHQRALQVPPGAGPDRSLGRLRLSHPDGLRLRPPPLRRRSGQVRRGHLQPGRHGDAVRRDSAGQGLHLDDDQRPGRHAVLLLRGGGRAAGRDHRRAAGHDPERHPEGVHGAARLDLPGGARAQDHRGPVRVGRGAHPQVEHHLDLRVPHPGGRVHRRPGAGVHAGQRLLLRGARPGPRPRGGQLRAPSLLLLGHPQRLLRGDRQAPGRAPDLGPAHARPLRRP